MSTMYETSTVDVEQVQPISRTYQYRKVMKPMLERKRRARINRCLDELKELMVSALQSDGENVAKLEKADILELTVRHLHKLRKARRLSLSPTPSETGSTTSSTSSSSSSSTSNGPDDSRFRAGYTHCAGEVSKCLAQTPGVDVRLGTKLMSHLGHRLNELEMCSPLSVRVSDAPLSPQYSLPPTPASSRSSDSPSPDGFSGLLKVVPQSVWRPW